MSQPFRPQLMHSDAAMDGAVEELEPQRHQSDVEPPPLASPPLAQWSTQADFLLHCSELAAGGIPASHPSQLAPLLAHPPSETIDYAVFYKEMEAAMAGTQAIKSGVAAAEPISCLRDPPHAALPPNGSKARIGIIVAYSAAPGVENQDNMYARSLRDKHEYAARHGYEVVVFGNVTMHGDKHILYLKWLGALIHLRRFDWVWMVDLDTIIMNHTIPLETFMDAQYNVVLSRDCGGINCGTMLVRNSTWSWMFLAEVYMHNGDGIRDGPGDWPIRWGWYPEQMVVWSLSQQERIMSRLKVLPQRGFNSYAGQDCHPSGTYQDGDFLVHFAGPPGKPLFNKFWSKRPHLRTL
ncbi:hypothetical protein COHA_000342 [Chlorella ohadii]|uniref:Uncharacterized protein n=1 Tax=Chlorella ohadii TaxID=2649997 RepID=A0AAD5HA25_9CHLO|nr:hypothetical protein COHA_000342 [Chlorella ohadii]